MCTQTASTIESALLVTNRPSGSSRTLDDIECLRSAFHDIFHSIANRVFVATQGHDEVLHVTRDFLRSFKGPCFLLSGGGGGTNRALVQGLMEEVEKQVICLDDVQISSLRLGSGNLIPKYFGMPHDPLDGMRQIANDLCAGQNDPCCVYRCTFHYHDGNTEQLYGLTLGGLGQFARVPDDIKRWKAKHAWLMHWATRLLPLEAINTLQYIASSVRRTIRCIAQPGQVEWVEVRYAGRCEQFRLLAGMLLNFDFPQLPIQGGCDIGEPRLVLCCIPYEGRRQTLRTLANWRNLDRRSRKYEVTRERPIEILFPDNGSTVLALDEDTFMAPAQIGFEVAGLVKFVTGTSFSRRTRLDDLLPVAHSVSAISTEESR